MSAIDRKIIITPEQLAQIESTKPTEAYYKALEKPSLEQTKTFSKSRFDAYFDWLSKEYHGLNPWYFFPIVIFNKLKEKPHVPHNPSLHLRFQ